MNYKAIFLKALCTPGALSVWLGKQPAYRLANIYPYLQKQIPAMERYQKRTGNGRKLKELQLNLKWVEQRHYCHVSKTKPCRANTIVYYNSLRAYIVMYLNDNIHAFDNLRTVARNLINSERMVGIYDPELWDGYACYIEAVEFDGVVGE